MPDDRDIERAIVELLARRAPGGSICPSEAARALVDDDWRALMPRVRDVAGRMAGTGAICATQGGDELQVASIRDARGPIRLRRGLAFKA